MTQLAGNEPSKPDAGQIDAGQTEADAGQRTSVLAVTALVLGLICFVPGLSVLAIILAISALLLISRSGGRLRGSSVAIAGLVVGLIVSAFWISVVVGGAQIVSIVKSRYSVPTQQSLAALESGNLPAARAMFSPAASGEISDQALAEFKDRYTAELGGFRGIPESLLDLISGYRQLQGVAGAFEGRNDVFAVPARFDKGVALLVLEEDPSVPRSAGVGAPASMKNVQIVTAKGTKIEIGVKPEGRTPTKVVPKTSPPPEAAPDQPAPAK